MYRKLGIISMLLIALIILVSCEDSVCCWRMTSRYTVNSQRIEEVSYHWSTRTSMEYHQRVQYDKCKEIGKCPIVTIKKVNRSESDYYEN